MLAAEGDRRVAVFGMNVVGPEILLEPGLDRDTRATWPPAGRRRSSATIARRRPKGWRWLIPAGRAGPPHFHAGRPRRGSDLCVPRACHHRQALAAQCVQRRARSCSGRFRLPDPRHGQRGYHGRRGYGTALENQRRGSPSLSPPAGQPPVNLDEHQRCFRWSQWNCEDARYWTKVQYQVLGDRHTLSESNRRSARVSRTRGQVMSNRVRETTLLVHFGPHPAVAARATRRNRRRRKRNNASAIGGKPT